jgi:hypothetical protein
MFTEVINMKPTIRVSTQKARKSIIIETTLYDLMETVIDVTGPDENNLIEEVTLNLLAKAKPSVRVLSQ